MNGTIKRGSRTFYATKVSNKVTYTHGNGVTVNGDRSVALSFVPEAINDSMLYWMSKVIADDAMIAAQGPSETKVSYVQRVFTSV